MDDDRTPDPHRPAPDQPVSRGGWTFETLKEFLLRIIADQERAVQAALRASDRAIEKAESADAKRFDSVNEFRKTLSDQTQTFITRTEVEGLLKALTDKLELATASLRTMVIALIGLALTTGIAVTIAITNLLTALQRQ